ILHSPTWRLRSLVHYDRRRRRLGLVLAVYRIVDLLAVDRNFLWGNNAQADFIAADLYHRYGNVVVDDDTFVFFPGQYEHRRLSFAECQRTTWWMGDRVSVGSRRVQLGGEDPLLPHQSPGSPGGQRSLCPYLSPASEGITSRNS